MNAILSQKIKNGRKLRALSQQKLAAQIGVSKQMILSKQMISKYENGLAVPSSKGLPRNIILPILVLGC